jgi:hypothetical protein
MLAEKLTFRNPSAVSDVRVLGQAKLTLTDENGQLTGVEWQAATADNCVGPAQTGTVVLSEKRRTLLETSSVDEIFIAIANTSLSQTLRVSRLTKKTGEVTPLGFAHPSKGGVPSDAIVAPLNSKTSIAIELLPK